MNRHRFKLLRRAGFYTCLFLFTAQSAVSQDFVFDEIARKAYHHVLNLQCTNARKVIGTPKNPAQLYVLSLADAVELLISEDRSLFEKHQRRNFEKSSSFQQSNGAEKLFLEAELNLRSAFIYLKFGKNFDAALSLRKASQLAESCKQKYPSYLPIRKTTGILNVVIGAVPEKHRWLLDLFGMRGSTTVGLQDLQLASQSQYLGGEAVLLHALIDGFILQRPASGLRPVDSLRDASDHQSLLHLIAGSLAIKNAESEKALIYLNKLEAESVDINISFSKYLTGEAYLHKGQYTEAIAAYDHFLRNYRGTNYIKDGWYKLGICEWLNGNESVARTHLLTAQRTGTEETEADKHAARSMEEETLLPNIHLTKVRYFTDGGFYEQATTMLSEISPADLITKKDNVEFYYRKGRLAHKQQQLKAAALFYVQTIEMAGDEKWYFAPNACLQLGYIKMELEKFNEARDWFRKAMTYDDHEYKNSIDSKARTAIDQLNRR